MSKIVYDLKNSLPASQQILKNIALLMVEKTDRNKFFQVLARQLKLYFYYDRLSINLYDSKNEILSLFTTADGTIIESLSQNRLAKSTVANMVINSRKPIILTDIANQVSNENAKALANVGLNATIALPLIVNKEIIGTIHCSFMQQPDNIIDILNFLLELTPTIAVFIFSLLAQERLETFNKEIVLPSHSLSISEKLVNLETSDMQEVISVVRKVCSLKVPILITGETGTGKSMLAQFIHQRSIRNKANFVKVNCPSLVPTLFESEMFGHAKGAFTGASYKYMGRIELAQHGTLFLDEIAELSLDMQSKLLQVIEEHAFERVGESRKLDVDLRVISATNVNIQQVLKEGKLRQDLFYRLSSVIINMPPLRNRPNDIPLLVNHFIHVFAEKYNLNKPKISDSIYQELQNHTWQGNIRELRNVIDRIMIESIENKISLDFVKKLLFEPDYHINTQDMNINKTRSNKNTSFMTDKLLSLEDQERNHICQALQICQGKLGGEDGAAKLLGIARTTLQHKIKKLKIQYKAIPLGIENKEML